MYTRIFFNMMEFFTELTNEKTCVYCLFSLIFAKNVSHQRNSFFIYELLMYSKKFNEKRSEGVLNNSV